MCVIYLTRLAFFTSKQPLYRLIVEEIIDNKYVRPVQVGGPTISAAPFHGNVFGTVNIFFPQFFFLIRQPLAK